MKCRARRHAIWMRSSNREWGRHVTAPQDVPSDPRAGCSRSARERKRRIVVDPAASTGARMFKYAVIFLIISLIAGAVGLTNVSRIAKRISLVLFALFFLVFLVLIGFAYLVGEAIQRAALVPAVVTVFT
jgi:uncharacterized membrane protein YtjA (UPF0391 family)